MPAPAWCRPGRLPMFPTPRSVTWTELYVILARRQKFIPWPPTYLAGKNMIFISALQTNLIKMSDTVKQTRQTTRNNNVWTCVLMQCWTGFMHVKLFYVIYQPEHQYSLNWIIYERFWRWISVAKSLKRFRPNLLIFLSPVLAQNRLRHVIRTDWPNANCTNNSPQMGVSDVIWTSFKSAAEPNTAQYINPLNIGCCHFCTTECCTSLSWFYLRV